MASPDVGVRVQPHNYANLFAQKSTNDEGIKAQRKGIWQVLHGIQYQLVQLNVLTAQASIKLRTKWSEEMKSLQDHILATKTLTHYDKTNEKSPLPALKDLKAQCEKISKGLTTIEDKLGTQNEVELKKLFHKLDVNIETSKKTKETATPKVQKEAARLEAKIELYAKNPTPDLDILDTLILRVRKAVPDYVLKRELELSQAKDKSRIERYEELKKEWKESILKHDEVLAMVVKLETAISTIPMIKEQTAKMGELQTSTKAQATALDSISISTFTSAFEEKGKVRRDLNDFHAALTTFQESKAAQSDLAPLVEALKTEAFQTKVKDALVKMSVEIERLGKEIESDISLEDADFKLKLKGQREAALHKLIEQRDQVERDWNHICLNIHEVRHRFETVTKTQDFVEVTGKYYLEAENIRENVRFTRKEKLLRSEHQDEFDAQKAKFEILSASILASEAVVSDDSEDPANDGSLTLLNKNYVASQISQDQITAFRQPVTTEELEKAGFVWSSAEKETATLEQFNAQRARFAAEMEIRNASIKEDFEIKLPYICRLAVDELNRMGKTLAIESSEYDDHFTKAYDPENWIGKVVGNAASSVANGLGALASGVVSLVWRSAEQQQGPQEETKVSRAPFVEIASPFA